MVQEVLDDSLVVLGCLSILGSAWIMIQPLRLWYFSKPRQSPGPILRLVACKALFDFLSVMKWLLSFLFIPGAFRPKHSKKAYKARMCMAMGWLGQFSALGSTSFNFCIAVDVFLLARSFQLTINNSGRSNKSRQGQVVHNSSLWLPYYVAYSIGLALVTSFILLPYYGPSGDGTCWLGYRNYMEGKGYWFLLYGFIMLYACFSIFVLWYCVALACNFRDNSDGIQANTQQARKLGRRVLLFTVASILAWISSLSIRWLEFLGRRIPETLSVIDDYALMCLGFWDLIIWFSPFEQKAESAGVRTVRESVTELGRSVKDSFISSKVSSSTVELPSQPQIGDIESPIHHTSKSRDTTTALPRSVQEA